MSRFANRTTLTAILAGAVLASTASAHDFWIIPQLFAFGADASVHINAQQGTKFADGKSIDAARVISARIVGASTEMKITDMAVVGTALQLHHKPTAAGQYLIAVSLAPRTMRTPPDGVIRFLRAESGASEATRLEREKTLAGLDTVVYTTASYAETTVEFGSAGPRSFTKSAGIPLEFVPRTDPSHLHVGDTLHVAVMGNGKAIAGIGIDAMPAADTIAAAGATALKQTVTLTADAQGIVHLPLIKAGPWMIRSAFASHKLGGAANEWDVSRTTYVFNVGAKH